MHESVYQASMFNIIQLWSVDPWGLQDPFRVSTDQYYLYNNIKIIFILYTFLTFTVIELSVEIGCLPVEVGDPFPRWVLGVLEKKNFLRLAQEKE